MRLIKSISLVALLGGIALLFSGCNPFCPPPISPPPPPPIDTKTCHLEGTLRYYRSNPNNDPATTYLGVTIMTVDGRRFTPCNPEFFDMTTYPNGSRILFGYSTEGCVTLEGPPVPKKGKGHTNDAPADNVVFITCVELMDATVPPISCVPLRKFAKGNLAGEPLDLYQDENCLKIKVGYSGCGKRTGDFSLTWDGNMTKSIPPQMNLALVDGLGDQITCKMYMEDELSFDISDIRRAANGPAFIYINGRRFDLK